LKFYTIKSIEEAEYVAEFVRASWDLGSGPILNMITVLEEHGIFVITVPFIEGFDGFSCWVNNNIPVIACRANIPGDRQRFNLAHELGHLILKIDDGLNEEMVCHRFAGAYLAPRKAVYNKLGQSRSSLDLDELLILKQEYEISMQAWARRAFDLHTLGAEIKKTRPCAVISMDSLAILPLKIVAPITE
jgi:Zn-dependent peptidase ImmA (M78 family)